MADDLDPDDLGARLLAAQIAFMNEQLRQPETFDRYVTTEVDAVLADAASITLAEAVTPETIKDTAYKYAVRLPLAGLIPEVVGEVAGQLYGLRVHDDVHVDEVIDQRHFDVLIEAIAQMDATDRIMRRLVASPVAVDICVEVIVAAIETGIREAGRDEGLRARTVSRVSSVVHPIVPALQSGTERIVRPGARFILDAIGDDGSAQLLDTAREMWRQNASESVGGFRELVTSDDVEDLIIVAVEFWRTFRETDYFRELLFEAIDHVFVKLGDQTLLDLLDNLGLRRDDFIGEAHRFGPPVIAELDRRGILDATLHRQFAPFYASEHFRAALADPDPDPV